MSPHFSVHNRNFGHWDIYTGIRETHSRAFRIRGGPGSYWVSDERPEKSRKSKYFKTVQACMSYICDELMFELIIAEGQDFEIIESWNI